LGVLEILAGLYIATGRGDQALALVEADLKANSDPNAVRELAGRVALAANRPDLAIQRYTELIQAVPNDAHLYFLLAQAQRARGDSHGAIISLFKAEQRNPNDPAALSVLAVLLQEIGRNGDAARYLRRVLQLRPGDANMMNNLAYLLADSGGDLKEATDLAQRALRAAPQEISYRDTLGWIYLKSKQAQIALEIFRNLSEREPKNPEYRYHLAMAQAAKGQVPEAQASLETALRNQPPRTLEAAIREAEGRLRKP
jgi:Flp pilus assembly protein TadD